MAAARRFLARRTMTASAEHIEAVSMGCEQPPKQPPRPAACELALAVPLQEKQLGFFDVLKFKA